MVGQVATEARPLANDDLDDDWESTALRLVADRVGALPARPAGAPPAEAPADADIGSDDGYGWEDTVIRRLRAWLYRDDPSR